MSCMDKRRQTVLTSEQIVDRLRGLPDVFEQAMKDKQYYKAKHCYNTAVTVASFIELDNTVREELFGVHGDVNKEVKEGRFVDKWVSKAYEECIKRDMTYEHSMPVRVEFKKS